MLIFFESFDGIATANLAAKGWTNSGSCTVGTTKARTGANALKLPSSNDWVRKGIPSSGAEDDVLIMGFAVNPDALTGGRGSLCNFMSDVGSTTHVSVGVSSTGAIVVDRWQGGTLASSAAGVIVAGVHNYVEVKAKLHDSTGFVVVRVNGIEVINATGLDTKNGGTKTVFDTVQFGEASGGSTSDDFYYDDVYLANEQGSINNDFLGECRVRCLLPTGNGNTSQFVGSDSNSVDNYALIDEVPPDTADFVGSSVDDNKDTYVFADLPDITGSVRGVLTSALAMKTDAGARTLAIVTRSGGTDYDSSDLGLPTVTPAYVSQARDTNPATGVAWLRSEVNSAEFGVKARP